MFFTKFRTITIFYNQALSFQRGCGSRRPCGNPGAFGIPDIALAPWIFRQRIFFSTKSVFTVSLNIWNALPCLCARSLCWQDSATNIIWTLFSKSSRGSPPVPTAEETASESDSKKSRNHLLWFRDFVNIPRTDQKLSGRQQWQFRAAAYLRSKSYNMFENNSVFLKIDVTGERVTGSCPPARANHEKIGRKFIKEKGINA